MRANLFALGTLALPLASAKPCEGTTPVFPPLVATYDKNYISCANANWPPPGPGSNTGSLLEPQRPDKELQAALAEVSAERIKETISKLVSFGTRHTLSPQNDTTRGIGAARNWIAAEFERYAEESDGRLTVETNGYIQQPTTRVPEPVKISNVQATLEGTEDPTRFYLTMGHYDTRVSDVLNWWDDQPGANDDASGVAVAMELARVMAKHKHRASLVFAAVAGEEQGLLGSGFMAQTYRNESTNIEGVLNVDLVGSSVGSRGEKEPHTIRMFCQGPPLTESDDQMSTRLSIGGENDSPARNLGRFIAEVATNKYTDMKVAMIYRLDRFLRGGDHRSFLEAGYDAAVRFTEPNEDFNHQHQDTRVEDGVQYGDLEEFLDYDFIARVARVDLAAMWSLANAPGQVQNVTIDTASLDNDSRLSWAKLDDEEVEGYEVVWRPTSAPQWTHAVFVGDVAETTVELSIDNVIFGVRSVGKNGYKSPASIPFPS
ncbi:peptidase M28 [Emericellopsis atlantica]|uniref:Peptide hydrolase n=1 Tax=Emericellopsis atlantica TaxID=2614577 RepID=A0A9P8CV18_9HYPO|nr:peptidase M28 [Emericellopsis atlantica]KAG9257941.1 peptidase M28 [Emericellopsis atlantica]